MITDFTSWDTYEKMIIQWPVITMVTSENAVKLQKNEDTLLTKINKVWEIYSTVVCQF